MKHATAISPISPWPQHTLTFAKEYVVKQQHMHTYEIINLLLYLENVYEIILDTNPNQTCIISKSLSLKTEIFTIYC